MRYGKENDGKEKKVKSWEFQCPKCAFFELVREYEKASPFCTRMRDNELDDLIEKYLRERFQDYFPD